MPPRLSALDASFLYLEQPSTPMHVGAVSIFQRAEGGFDYDRLVELIEQRIALVPRYRQKVRHVPGQPRPAGVGRRPRLRRRLPRPPLGAAQAGLGRPAHRAGGPADVAAARPRTARCGRCTSSRASPWPHRPCSPRPTRRWSTASARSTSARSSSTSSPEPRVAPEELWMPRNEPTDAELICEAVAEAIARPGRGGRQRAGRRGRRGRHGRQARAARRAGRMARTGEPRPAPDTPLNVPISTQRRFASPAPSSRTTARSAPRTGAR